MAISIKNKTSFKIIIPDGGYVMPLTFQQDAAHHVWVDWGDRSYPDTYTYEGLVEAKHTYAKGGEYSITMEVVDDGYLVLGGNWTGSNIVGGSDEAAARMLIEAHIGDDVVSVADYAFRGCENLEVFRLIKDHELVIGKFAFDGCGSLETIKIPEVNAIVPDCCFYNCSNLKKVELPKGTYEIRPSAFYGCANLREINLQGVTKISSDAFSGCRKLTEVILGKEALSIVDDAFNGCSNLTKIELGTTKTIGARAFYGAKSLQYLAFTDSISSVGHMAFAGCTSLKQIKMATGNPPVLMSSAAIEPTEDLQLLVPKGSGKKYAEATNWCVLSYAIREV